METKVEFRKIRNRATKEMEIIAIFVGEDWDADGREVASYMHIGQHGGCEKALVKRLKFATEAEYAPLKQELERRYDYRLKVLNKAA